MPVAVFSVVVQPAFIMSVGAEGIHKVIGNYFSRNSGGAMRYSTVGEKNPGIVVNGELPDNLFWH